MQVTCYFNPFLLRNELHSRCWPSIPSSSCPGRLGRGASKDSYCSFTRQIFSSLPTLTFSTTLPETTSVLFSKWNYLFFHCFLAWQGFLTILYPYHPLWKHLPLSGSMRMGHQDVICWLQSVSVKQPLAGHHPSTDLAQGTVSSLRLLPLPMICCWAMPSSSHSW